MRNLIAIALGISLSAAASAQFSGPGSSERIATVASVQSARDDTRVILEGHLTRKLSDEHYLFQDATGAIEVEIDSEDFRGARVKPETRVRINAEVDREWNRTTLEVDSISIVSGL